MHNKVWLALRCGVKTARRFGCPRTRRYLLRTFYAAGLAQALGQPTEESTNDRILASNCHTGLKCRSH